MLQDLFSKLFSRLTSLFQSYVVRIRIQESSLLAGHNQQYLSFLSLWVELHGGQGYFHRIGLVYPAPTGLRRFISATSFRPSDSSVAMGVSGLESVRIEHLILIIATHEVMIAYKMLLACQER